MLFRSVIRLTPRVRSFHSGATARNLVQDLYLKEVKNFKPTVVSAKDAESSVIQWAVPKSPSAPAVEATDAADLSAYESSSVEVEVSKPVGEDAPAASLDEWFVVEDQFADTAAHH